MLRLVCRSELPLMARGAVRRQGPRIRARVACLAREHAMRTGQLEPGRGMIEPRTFPRGAGYVVAGLTISREAGAPVVGQSRGGKLARVTAHTVRRDPSHGGFASALVAVRAFDQRVHPAQREPRCSMEVKRPRAIGPTVGRMTILTPRSPAALVNVSVAVGTTGGNSREDFRSVTLPASRGCVFSHQWEASRGVVEVRALADLRPRLSGVACLAHDADVSVRVAGGTRWPGGFRRSGARLVLDGHGPEGARQMNPAAQRPTERREGAQHYNRQHSGQNAADRPAKPQG
jgi:hypothetical protein